MYEETMSIPCARMIISALDLITGADGTGEGQKRYLKTCHVHVLLGITF
jgi:hypothetical protein